MFRRSSTAERGRRTTMFLSIVLVSIATVVRSNSTSTVLPVPSEKLKCLYLEQPLCRNTGYNRTALPNARQHESQEEAAAEMADFSRLWTEGVPCSNAIAHFLCSFYFPFCGNLGESAENTTLRPCRNLCETARAGCQKIIEENTAVGWPTFLECSSFPEQSSGLCFGPPDPSSLTLPGGELNTAATTDRDFSTTPTSQAASLSNGIFSSLLLITLLNIHELL